MKTEITTEALKLAPPATVALHSLWGFTYQEWVYIATFVYVTLNTGFLIWKWRKAAKDEDK